MDKEKAFGFIILPVFTICGGMYHISFWDTFNVNGLSFISLTDIIKSAAHPIFFSGFVFFSTLFFYYISNMDFISGNNANVKSENKRHPFKLFVIYFLLAFFGYAFMYVFSFNKVAYKYLIIGFIFSKFICVIISDKRIFRNYFTSHLKYLISMDILICLPLFSFFIGKYKSVEIRDNLKFKYTVQVVNGPNGPVFSDSLKLLGKTEDFFIFSSIDNKAIKIIKQDKLDTLVLYDK